MGHRLATDEKTAYARGLVELPCSGRGGIRAWARAQPTTSAATSTTTEPTFEVPTAPASTGAVPAPEQVPGAWPSSSVAPAAFLADCASLEGTVTETAPPSSPEHEDQTAALERAAKRRASSSGLRWLLPWLLRGCMGAPRSGSTTRPHTRATH